MNIKEKIGRRIREERTLKGLTRKALAELTEDLKVSRINNYERGERTPGPSEILQLATALDVSAAFLMCLSDSKEGKLHQSIHTARKLLPVFNHKQAHDFILKREQFDSSIGDCSIEFTPISQTLATQLGEHSFALKIEDNSMAPELRLGDVVIISTANQVKPGDFVLVKLNEEDTVIVRKYRQLSAAKDAKPFELIALNEDWANISIEKDTECHLIGTVVQLTRDL